MEAEDQTLLMQRAVFGRQVDDFMSSDIGRYLLDRARDEREIAQDEFKKVDCTNTPAILSIQHRILVADAIEGWLRDAVGDGLQALNILEDRS